MFKIDFALIWVIVATIIGLRIIWKALSLKRNELITVGLTWCLIASAWWGVALQFITYGFFNYRLTDFQYLLVANIGIPVALVCWTYSFAEIVNPKLKKNFFLIMVAFFAFWEVFLISCLLIDTRLVGVVDSLFNSTHSRIQLIFVFSRFRAFIIKYFVVQGQLLTFRFWHLDLTNLVVSTVISFLAM